MSKRAAATTHIRLDQVLDKYWELANLNPALTKDTITGQLKALDALAAELSAGTGAPRPLRPEGVYRAAWLVEPDEPGREN